MANTPSYLAKNQFVGPIELDFGNYENFNEFAYYIEQKYMVKLLGDDLKLALQASPETTKYANLLNGVEYEHSDGQTYDMKGIKEMLKWFFYYHFVIEEEDENTQADPQQAYIRAVNGVKFIKNRKTIRAFNRGVDLYDEVIKYIDHINGVTANTYDDWIYETLEKINSFGI